MKKAIYAVIAVAVVGMVGWTIYDFLDGVVDDDEEEITEENMITSQAPDANDDAELSDEVGIEQGQVAPDFELEKLGGETVSLSDYRGERVILNFWATWCPPCREEIPDLQEQYDDKDDVEILAVNLTETETNEDDVGEFVEDYNMTFPVLMDVESEISELYEVHAYPTTYMIDSKGHIQYMAIGGMDYDMIEERLKDMD